MCEFLLQNLDIFAFSSAHIKLTEVYKECPHQSNWVVCQVLLCNCRLLIDSPASILIGFSQYVSWNISPRQARSQRKNLRGAKEPQITENGQKRGQKGFIWGCTGFIWGCTGFLFGGAQHPFVPRWLRACPKVKIAILSTINITIIYTISHNMSKQIVRFSKHNTTLISVKNL